LHADTRKRDLVSKIDGLSLPFADHVSPLQTFKDSLESKSIFHLFLKILLSVATPHLLRPSLPGGSEFQKSLGCCLYIEKERKQGPLYISRPPS
jgi:hypothetical protein